MCVLHICCYNCLIFVQTNDDDDDDNQNNKKLSYCWETVRCESQPTIAEMDVEMTT